MTTGSKCPVCEDLPRGPLCKTHRQELAKIIHALRLGMVELKAVERREVKLSGHGGGGARPAFAPTPLDISAADLYDDTEDVIQDVAGDIGLWAGKAPQLLARMAARTGRLADAPNSGRDYRSLSQALHRVRMRLAPPEDRIIHGHCLNPACHHELPGLPQDTMVTCPACGSTWTVSEVHRVRRERLEGQYITGKPKQIAAWVKSKTGVPVKSQDVRNWLRRGLPSEKNGAGEYVCAVSDLLDQVEKPHPGLKLTA